VKMSAMKAALLLAGIAAFLVGVLVARILLS
jgi:hypothetical protein